MPKGLNLTGKKQINDNCFIDTNILVFCFTNDEPAKRQAALNIVNDPNTFISTLVLTELSNTLKKKFKQDWQTIEKVIAEVSSDFNIYVNKPATIERACQIADKYQYSFYDSLIITAALSSNCITLYTEDMQDGQVIDNILTIVNPFK
ncbi:MAG: PIN domain-containing protein [Bacteroidales bacterium]|nr:PIN domain-containing protein [Bacteroidales bacterium]